MPPHETTLALAPGLRWRVYADGIVVYVAETCETHLLPAEFARFMPALQGPMKAVGANGAEPPNRVQTASVAAIPEAAIAQLVALRIFDRLDN
ncbi:MAG: hypothetical protein ACYC9Z_04405 [Casimicrobiaceae bacterium]